jgi:hypothetical protein
MRVEVRRALLVPAALLVMVDDGGATHVQGADVDVEIEGKGEDAGEDEDEGNGEGEDEGEAETEA